MIKEDMQYIYIYTSLLYLVICEDYLVSFKALTIWSTDCKYNNRYHIRNINIIYFTAVIHLTLNVHSYR